MKSLLRIISSKMLASSFYLITYNYYRISSIDAR